jgi:ubiquinone/menaquinone biosynthesis C-methylase UbiE
MISFLLSKENLNGFKANMAVYDSQCFLVKNLYWKRIKTAINFAQIKDDHVLLDIGCNQGHLFKVIRKFNKTCKCSGIDIEPNVVNLNIENCSFKVANVNHLPFEDNYFDVVFALSTLEHISDIDIAIREIKRVLKPNGSIIVSSPTESWFYRLCRFLIFGVSEKNVYRNKPGFQGEADFHFQNAYKIEQKLKENGFTQILQRSLPGFPIPELHRIVKFQK